MIWRESRCALKMISVQLQLLFQSLTQKILITLSFEPDVQIRWPSWKVYNITFDLTLRIEFVHFRLKFIGITHKTRGLRIKIVAPDWWIVCATSTTGSEALEIFQHLLCEYFRPWGRIKHWIICDISNMSYIYESMLTILVCEDILSSSLASVDPDESHRGLKMR